MDDSDASIAEARRRIGTTLRGKWRLERLLGIGGMGAVYEGRHRNGMRGAVKVLDPALARTKEGLERFIREGRLANEVAHPGVVSVLDDDDTGDGSAFLVMELLSGATLDVMAMKRGGLLPPEELLRYAAQVADTLVAMHARDIIHRDIKPENIFLTDDGIVKVLDFGVARGSVLGESQRVTYAGQPIGTPAFMAPEQARGRWEDVDARADIYSLGAAMFTLATGEMVHNEATVAELLVKVITEPARPVRQVLDVSPALAAVIDKALSHDKRARFQSAVAMRAAIEAAYREIVGEAVPPTPVVKTHTTSDPDLSRAAQLLRARFVTTQANAPSRARLRSRWTTAVALTTSAVVVVATVLLAAPRPQTAIAQHAAPRMAAAHLHDEIRMPSEEHVITVNEEHSAPAHDIPTPRDVRVQHAAHTPTHEPSLGMSRYSPVFQRRY